MKPRFAWLPIVPVALALIASPAAAAGPIKLQYKFKKGDKLIYRATKKVKKTEVVNNNTFQTLVESRSVDLRTFKRKDKRGNFQFEDETKRVKVDLKVSQIVDNKAKPIAAFKYDSQSTDNDSTSAIGALLTPVLDTLNGATFTVTITPDGEVLPFKGFKELMAGVVTKDNPFAAGYSDEAYRLEFAESVARLSDKPVKPGDTWTQKYSVKLPNVGTVKGEAKYKYEGEGRIGNRKTVRISATYEGTIEVDAKRAGGKVTGTLTVSDSKGVIHFDPRTGRLVSKERSTRTSGSLNIEAGNNTLTVDSDQTDNLKVELLEKLPE